MTAMRSRRSRTRTRKPQTFTIQCRNVDGQPEKHALIITDGRVRIVNHNVELEAIAKALDKSAMTGVACQLAFNALRGGQFIPPSIEPATLAHQRKNAIEDIRSTRKELKIRIDPIAVVHKVNVFADGRVLVNRMYSSYDPLKQPLHTRRIIAAAILVGRAVLKLRADNTMKAVEIVQRTIPRATIGFSSTVAFDIATWIRNVQIKLRTATTSDGHVILGRDPDTGQGFVLTPDGLRRAIIYKGGSSGLVKAELL